MRNLTKRGLSMLVVLALIVSLLSGISITASAATTFVANWGDRGDTATQMSSYASAFYTGDYTYEKLSVLSGSSSLSAVPDSPLYDALHALMYNNLDDYTTYDETKNLFAYTDCEGGDPSYISSFYSGKALDSAWDGSTWNREHVWPNSKSAGGSNSNTRRETDIMMLRPTSTSENSSRGNSAYGVSSGFYNPNGESDGTLDLRGDVSRVVLYVYVCWGESDYADGCLDYMWGSSGVIESKDVLLAWMEADPVDTWELGRNDAVQSITGTRNVFVDYPEYAFQLFGEEVPANYTTPSGLGGCDHANTTDVAAQPATCKNAGYTAGVQCDDCGKYISGHETIAATGNHNYVDGVCSVCNSKESPEAIIYAPAYNMALSSEYPTGSYYNSGVAFTLTDGETPSYGDSVVWTVIDNGDGTYSFAQNDQLLGMGDSFTSMSMGGVNNTWKIIDLGNGLYNIENVGREGYFMEWYAGNSYWCSYNSYNPTTDDRLQLSFYTVNGKLPFVCYHEATYEEIFEATCTEDGATVNFCDDCDLEVSRVVIPATGHKFTNGICENCSASDAIYSVSFVVPNGVTAVEDMDCGYAGIELPSAEAPTGYTFVGWVSQKVDSTDSKPEVLNAGDKFEAAADTTLYALYCYSLGGESTDIVFEFGANGDATHADGNEIAEGTQYTGSDNSTKITLTGVSKVYGSAYDAMGNSALKLGTGSVEAAFSFTVPENVTKVTFQLAGYKATALKVSINGGATQTISTLSNNGEYTAVEVDTTVNKTVSLATISGTNRRGMINSITYTVVAEGSVYYTTEICLHTETTETVEAATCTEPGSKTVKCDDCGAVIHTEELAPNGHDHIDGVCIECGDTIYVRFITPVGVTAIPAVVASGKTFAMPSAGVPTGEFEYTFVGWAEAPIDNKTAASYTGTIYEAGDSAAFEEEIKLYAVYGYSITSGGDAGGSAEEQKIVFEFGDNKNTTTHADGTEFTSAKTFSSGNYSLVINPGSKVYSGGNDATGKSILKLGTSSAIGKFTFDVPNEVTSVIINVAKYKAKTTKIQVNGASYTISTSSDAGSYTPITVDTSTNKTVSFTTVSGGVRCVIDSITYVIPGAGSEPVTTDYVTTVINEGMEAPELKFAGASLTITNGISVNFKVDPSLFANGLYADPTAEFLLDGKTYMVDEYSYDSDGKLVFTLNKVNPSMMSETITATLHATLGGDPVTGTSKDYSVSDYCYNHLNNSYAQADAADEFATLLVNLLNYGAAAQVYENSDENGVVTDDLTETWASWITTDYTAATPDTSLSNDLADPAVQVKSATLFLRETVRIRLRLLAESTDGLSLVVTDANNKTIATVTEDDFIVSGSSVYVFFDELIATQMREVVKMTVYKDGQAVSNTLTYSIRSYADKEILKDSTTDLAKLVKAMMLYGDAAIAYVTP